MLWIHFGNYTFQIIGYNLHTNEDGVQSLWVTRNTGKTQKIYEGEDVDMFKSMLDHAIESGRHVVEV